MAADVQKIVTGEDENGNEMYDYQFGAKVDGVFVPFVTKSGGYIDHLVAAGKAAAKDKTTDEEPSE